MLVRLGVNQIDLPGVRREGHLLVPGRERDRPQPVSTAGVRVKGVKALFALLDVPKHIVTGAVVDGRRPDRDQLLAIRSKGDAKRVPVFDSRVGRLSGARWRMNMPYQRAKWLPRIRLPQQDPSESTRGDDLPVRGIRDRFEVAAMPKPHGSESQERSLWQRIAIAIDRRTGSSRDNRRFGRFGRRNRWVRSDGD